MANSKHFEILRSGLDNWTNWRKANKDMRPDLNGVNLNGADLIRVNLNGADLNRASLSRAALREANLSEANLSEANLSETNLRGADLSGADLRGARLCRANLSGADLSGADLSGADLSGANLSEANLSEANLSRANLKESNLRESNLSECNLSEAKLHRTVFGLTDLSSCQNLDSVEVSGECVIDFPTLRASKNLRKEFLTKLGIPDLLMEYLPEFYNPALMISPAFLSHSWGDKEFVRKLYEALTKKGVTVWLDEKKMKPGDNIHDSISEGIKYYDKLILACSENSLNSWWVEKELERVYEKERELKKERGKKYRLVIPIRIDDSIFNCTDGILGTVKGSLIGDFTRWQDEQAFEKAVKELVDALNANRVDVKPPSYL